MNQATETETRTGRLAGRMTGATVGLDTDEPEKTRQYLDWVKFEENPEFDADMMSVTATHESVHALDTDYVSTATPAEKRAIANVTPADEDEIGIRAERSERNDLFEPGTKSREDAQTLSKRVRGPFEAFPDDANRESPSELTADVGTSMALEPFAARREAPAAVEEMEETFDDFDFPPLL